MKNLIFIWLLICSTLFIACEKEAAIDDLSTTTIHESSKKYAEVVPHPNYCMDALLQDLFELEKALNQFDSCPSETVCTNCEMKYTVQVPVQPCSMTAQEAIDLYYQFKSDHANDASCSCAKIAQMHFYQIVLHHKAVLVADLYFSCDTQCPESGGN